jgi:hypothetical protein
MFYIVVVFDKTRYNTDYDKAHDEIKKLLANAKNMMLICVALHMDRLYVL